MVRRKPMFEIAKTNEEGKKLDKRQLERQPLNIDHEYRKFYKRLNMKRIFFNRKQAKLRMFHPLLGKYRGYKKPTILFLL